MHISELATHHVENPREVVQPGDVVRVKILEIDSERRRLSLSVKRVEGQVLPSELRRDAAWASRVDGRGDLDDVAELGLSEDVFAGEGDPTRPPVADEDAAAVEAELPVEAADEAADAEVEAPAAEAPTDEAPAEEAAEAEARPPPRSPPPPRRRRRGRRRGRGRRGARRRGEASRPPRPRRPPPRPTPSRRPRSRGRWPPRPTATLHPTAAPSTVRPSVVSGAVRRADRRAGRRASRPRSPRSGGWARRRSRPTRSCTSCTRRPAVLDAVSARWGAEVVAPAASSTAARSPRHAFADARRARVAGGAAVAAGRRSGSGRSATEQESRRPGAEGRGGGDAAAVRGRDGRASTTRRSRSSPTRTCAAARAAARGHEAVDERAARQLSQDEKAQRATFAVAQRRYGGGPGGRAVLRACQADGGTMSTRTATRIRRSRRAVARRRAPSGAGAPPPAAGDPHRRRPGACAPSLTLRPALHHAVKEIALPLRHEDIIRQQAHDKGLDPALIAGVIYAESHFIDGRTSSAGAQGLMQLTPDTAQYIAQQVGRHRLPGLRPRHAPGQHRLRRVLPALPDEALRRGRRRSSLAAYNAGEGNVDKWVAAARAKDKDLEHLRDPLRRDALLRHQGPRRAQAVPHDLPARAGAVGRPRADGRGRRALVLGGGGSTGNAW